ncbi:MAG: threonylcarbamoyl-AMP synthase [Methanothrix sp.]|jgi:L-threonylcarbamoyladenylate synthase|nr:threonylcarbamoyl-AMP synthase [Methanothrix sp.]
MIASAARQIIGGGVIVYPTETVYGLGANALDEQAVMRVFQIKKRPLSMPIFMAVSSIQMLEKVATITEDDMDLLEQLFPGPVSVLVRKRSIVPDILTAGSPLVGIRIPDHETALKIIDLAGPITSTSANRTGSPPPTSAAEVSREIADRVDLVVDGGKSRYAEPSTLLDLCSRKIIRPGAGLDKVLKAIS